MFLHKVTTRCYFGINPYLFMLIILTYDIQCVTSKYVVHYARNVKYYTTISQLASFSSALDTVRT